MTLLLLFAFIAGIITVLSPCILPVLPIILASSLTGGKKKPLGIIAGFILSFTFFTLFSFALLSAFGISTEVLRIMAVGVLILAGMTLFIPQMGVWLEILTGKLMATMQPRAHGASANEGFPRNELTEKEAHGEATGRARTSEAGGFATAERSELTKKSEPKKREGFWGGVIIGISLGLFWTPCVGPILAGVITLAATSSVTFEAFLITLAYSLGTAIPMFFITWGGRQLLQKVPWITHNAGKVQKVFGVIMVLLAMGLLFNLDRKFQAWVLDTFPQYGTGLTQIEESDMIRDEIDRLQNSALGTSTQNSPSKTTPVETDSQSSTTAKNYPSTPNPNFDGATKWLNSEALTLEKLKGKVVLVDFWTYTCINCIRTLPYITAWHETYKDDGLVIIGVHTPEFEFERNENNVRTAMKDYGITYPVVQDNEFKIWRSYQNRYWPAKYFIDKNGSLRHTHFGEGEYEESERIIRELLAEDAPQEMESALTSKKADPTISLVPGNYARTPESYLGYGRIDRFFSQEKLGPSRAQMYTAPKPLTDLPLNGLAYEGNWTVHQESALPTQGAKLHLNFEGKEVYLVMRPADTASQDRSMPTSHTASIKVYLDSTEITPENSGDDIQNAQVTVSTDRLYKLVKLPSAGNHILTLEFLDSNADLYAFTFG